MQPEPINVSRINPAVKSFTGVCLAQCLLILSILTVGLRLWSVDISVPFQNWGDTTWVSVPIKGMIENGWNYTIPQLSAPFVLNAAAFPSMTHTDWLIMKTISLFTRQPGTVLNVFWLFSIVLTAWTATLAFVLIGTRIRLAAVVGVVYALLPFAMLRNVAHISLVYYCVPLLGMLCLRIVQSGENQLSTTVRTIGYAASVAQGLDYIYYSFFATILFTFAGALGFASSRSLRPVKEATIACLIILSISSINLIPSFVSWHMDGKPPDMSYKSSQEAEVYGLKIRRMLVPNDANQVPGFGQWARRDKSSSFPNENENVSARLGPMAAVGLVFLLMLLLGLVRLKPSPESETIRRVASLTLFAVLFTTVGGFGAIFNLGLPEFRAYNRFSVFIAFFALSAIALGWQDYYKNSKLGFHRFLGIAAITCLASFSLYDQLLDLDYLRLQRSDQEAQATRLRALVKNIESAVPRGSLVFQLPVTGFPPDGGLERMPPYAHGQAYLASSSLHWSWPSFSQRHRAWQDHIQSLRGADLIETLVLSNFRLIWLDRFGYADNGDQMVKDLVASGAQERLTQDDPRFVVLDLHAAAISMKTRLGELQFERRRQEYLDTPTVNWGAGFYAQEHNATGTPFRWSQKTASIEIHNWSNKALSYTATFCLASNKNGVISVSSANHTDRITAGPKLTQVTLPIILAPRSMQVINFDSNTGKIDLPPGETRDLHFFVMDMVLKKAPNSNLKAGEGSGS